MRYTATGITERDDRCGTRPSGELRSPTPAVHMHMHMHMYMYVVVVHVSIFRA